jgi:hypothetical protein
MNDEIKRNLKGLLFSALFVAAGLVARLERAPTAVWVAMLAFGASCVLLLGAAVLYQAFTGRPLRLGPAPGLSGDAKRVVLKDGRDYRVEVDDERVLLTHRRSGAVKAARWSGLTAVHLVAIDGYPVGGISWMLHGADGFLEIPSDAAGNAQFLAKMQQKLPDLDNRAIIEAMGMLHGFKEVWNKP